MKRVNSAAVIGVVVLALVGGAAWGYKAWQRDQECGRISAAVDSFGTAPVSRGSESVVVLGDSYSMGWTLDDPRTEAWPAELGDQLGATVTVDGFGGTGFASSNYCDGESYPERADDLPDADMTIVQGGLNDVSADAAEIRSGLRQVLTEVDGPVVVVGPPMAPQRDASEVRAVDAALADTAQAEGVRYVSTLDWHLDYGADQLHPTAAGQETFAAAVAERVRPAL